MTSNNIHELMIHHNTRTSKGCWHIIRQRGRLLGPHIIDQAAGKLNPICILTAHDDHTMIINFSGAMSTSTTKYHGLLTRPC
eukprot:CAMPEP_0196801856 /NCGR_PEP_ID=MMETSP1362-20130617/1639_1 /TAXON_ID=163516 /ORGANISM="Leptocylindrus danicus, Strain CCMP1856" /LENGTH=81 /DNA_ID=CAMNT_0042173021 /DNA_START=19 /DNA_END=261 /DNA_ORIENTATION=-